MENQNYFNVSKINCNVIDEKTISSILFVLIKNCETIEKIVNQYNDLQWWFANKNDSWYVDLSKIIKIS